MPRGWTKNAGSAHVAHFEAQVRSRRNNSQIDAPPVGKGYSLANMDDFLKEFEDVISDLTTESEHHL